MSDSDEKKARLEAIRAANRAKAAAEGNAPATPPPAVAAPADAAATAPAAPTPAAKAALVPRKPVPRPIKLIAGVLFGILVVGLLATTTGQYIPAIIFGAIFGAVTALMFGNWPPAPGDDVTSGGE